jgi:hypothetical protein
LIPVAHAPRNALGRASASTSSKPLVQSLFGYPSGQWMHRLESMALLIDSAFAAHASGVEKQCGIVLAIRLKSLHA